MAVNQKIAEALKRISFEHREADYHHHTYDEDMFQYELIRNGDMKAAEIGKTISFFLWRPSHWPPVFASREACRRLSFHGF